MQVRSVPGISVVSSTIGINTVAALDLEYNPLAELEHHHHHHEEHDHAAFTHQRMARRTVRRTYNQKQPIVRTVKNRVSRRAVRRTQTRRSEAVQAVPRKRAPKYLPVIAAADAEDQHKAIANNVLMNMPEACRETLQHWYVKYTKQKHRGLAGKSVMILDATVPLLEFLALFVHESGHNFDLGCLVGTPQSGKSAFADGQETIYKDDPSVGYYQISWITSNVQRSNSKPEDFVSGYASYNIFEDFSETFAYFYLHNAEFAKRAQTNEVLARKYVWMRDVMFGGTIPTVATGNAPFTGRVPWDITKLDFTWHPELHVAMN